jgi:hypothetical protein
MLIKKADPKDNTGLVVGVVTCSPPNPNPNNFGVIPGIVTKGKDGRYWLDDPVTGLRYEIVPGASCGTVDGWVKDGQKKPKPKGADVPGRVDPPANGSQHPTISVNPCFEGPLSIENPKDPNKRKAFITDAATGAKIELQVPPNSPLWSKKPGTRLRVCGYVTNKANPNNNTGLVVTPYDPAGGPGFTEIPPNRKPLPPPKCVTGTVVKDGDQYYLDDPVTGLRYELKPDKDQKAELDKAIERQNQRKNDKLPPIGTTIEGTVKPGKDGKYPTIENPKQVSQGAAVVPAGGGIAAHPVVLTVVGLGAVGVVTGLVVESGHHNTPVSPP